MGKTKEDPTAVKDLPIWKNKEGKEIQVVGRKVNTLKGKVGESGDPFYEYEILKKLAEMELPAAKPIGTIKQNGDYFILTERIPRLRWSEKDNLHLKEKGYSDEDITSLMAQAEQKMDELKVRFDQAGVIRSWKLKDMVFEIDFQNKKITSMVPTDWERTKIVERE